MAFYYVDYSDGLDENPGTAAEPWKTTAKVETEFVAGTFGPGDRIRFQAGDIWPLDQRFRLRGCSGTPQNPIILEPWGAGARPKLDLQGDTLFVGRYDYDDDADYIAIRGFEICNNLRNVLMCVHGCTGWVIRDCYLHDADDTGGWAAGMQFRFCVDAQVLDTVIGPNIGGEGIYIGDAADPDDISNVYMRGLYISGCGNEAVDIKVGKSAYCYLLDSVIDGCGGDEGKQVNLEGTDHVMQRVRVLNSAAGLNQAIRVGGYGSPNYSGRRIVVKQVFMEGPANGDAITLYGDENTIDEVTIVGADTGISASSAGWTPEASQVLSNIAFDDGLTIEIDYVSDPGRFIVSGNHTISTWADTVYYNLPSDTEYPDCGWRPRSRDRGGLQRVSAMANKGLRSIMLPFADDYVELPYDETEGMDNAEVAEEVRTRLGDDTFDITTTRKGDDSFTVVINN